MSPYFWFFKSQIALHWHKNPVNYSLIRPPCAIFNLLGPTETQICYTESSLRARTALTHLGLPLGQPRGERTAASNPCPSQPVFREVSSSSLKSRPTRSVISHGFSLGNRPFFTNAPSVPAMFLLARRAATFFSWSFKKHLFNNHTRILPYLHVILYS